MILSSCVNRSADISDEIKLRQAQVCQTGSDVKRACLRNKEYG